MLILGQDGDVMVNVGQLHCLSVYRFTEENVKRFRILAWYGICGHDCWGIGDYVTEERAKEVLQEIWEKYGEYFHRKGGPAMLIGSVNVPEGFWALPKVYEMPKE